MLICQLTIPRMRVLIARMLESSKTVTFSRRLSNFLRLYLQSIIFHVDTHPTFRNFTQCVTFGVLSQSGEVCNQILDVDLRLMERIVAKSIRLLIWNLNPKLTDVRSELYSHGTSLDKNFSEKYSAGAFLLKKKLT
jgi:hypothetical protein